MKKEIVFLTGAGISKDSGLPLFQDGNIYNDLFEKIKTAEPNEAHHFISSLQSKYDVCVITQNIDELHEKAGSKEVIHLHGTTKNMIPFGGKIIGLERAIMFLEDCDVFVMIGTSLNVSPANLLHTYTKPSCEVYYIDPNPAYIPPEYCVGIINKNAIDGLKTLKL